MIENQIMEYIASVKPSGGNRYDSVGGEELQLHTGDYCIVRNGDNYLEYCRVMQLRNVSETTAVQDLPRIQRKADEHDHEVALANEERAKSAYRMAEQMVEAMGLPMKLLNAMYTFDQKLVTIQFTADGRVDFRELVKELSKSLGARLELRQIGVRDETSICGGIAVCGQVLCCSRFLREFNSINVRMAKEQDLSLTPATISGVCGRLKCCLKYEHAGYVEMEKDMPRRGELCECAKGKGRVCDRNLLTRKVTLHLEDGGQITLPVDEVSFRNRLRKVVEPVPAENANGAAERNTPVTEKKLAADNGNNRKAPVERRERDNKNSSGAPKINSMSRNPGKNSNSAGGTSARPMPQAMDESDSASDKKDRKDSKNRRRRHRSKNKGNGGKGGDATPDSSSRD